MEKDDYDDQLARLRNGFMRFYNRYLQLEREEKELEEAYEEAFKEYETNPEYRAAADSVRDEIKGLYKKEMKVNE